MKRCIDFLVHVKYGGQYYIMGLQDVQKQESAY